MIIFGLVLMVVAFAGFMINMWRHLGIGDIGEGIAAMIGNLMWGVVFVCGAVSAAIGSLVELYRWLK
jgi:hypothetical protein